MENEHRRHHPRRVVVVVVITFPRRTDLLYINILLERERKREKLVCKILMRCCILKGINAKNKFV